MTEKPALTAAFKITRAENTAGETTLVRVHLGDQILSVRGKFAQKADTAMSALAVNLNLSERNRQSEARRIMRDVFKAALTDAPEHENARLSEAMDSPEEEAGPTANTAVA